jgi:hypothetical protein
MRESIAPPFEAFKLAADGGLDMYGRVVTIFVLLIFLGAGNIGYGQQPAGPAGAEPKEQEKAGPLPSEPVSGKAGKVSAPPLDPSMRPGMENSKEMQAGDVFFAAGALSPNDEFLYVVFDRFLLQYDSKTLDLKKKADLGIPAAPVTPSITVSKDGKHVYVISNGILLQINVTTFEVEKSKKVEL